jgi:hypothetical protein
MKKGTSNSILRFLPSLTDVAFLMPLVFLFTRMQGVRTMLGDGDTGWHIRAGEWMLAHHAIIRTDPFSFTKPGQPWFAWEWLWEVCFAWLHQRGGLGLVVLVSMLVICTTFALLFRVLNRRCGNPLIAAALTLLAAAGSSIHWLARPHLFTFLFSVVFLALLDRVAEGRTRLLLWLPALTIVWTNVHGGFLTGILILAAYIVGELLRGITAPTPNERQSAFRAAVPYGLTAAACAAASLVNPYFYHLHQHILDYFRDPTTTQSILEFQSISFQMPAAGFFEAMLVFAAGAAIWFGSRRRFAEVLLMAGWAHLALLMARNVPIFMIVAAPAVAEAAGVWMKSLQSARAAAWVRNAASTIGSIAQEMAPMEAIWRLHVLPVVVVTLIVLGIKSPHAGPLFKPAYDEMAYPSHALAWLTDPSLRVFTHDEWGDYLIYHLWPFGGKVFVDGRSDFYGGKFTHEYLDVLNVKYNWEETLARFGVNTVLMPPDSPLASTLKESQHWRVVYDDGKAIVFRSAPLSPVSQVSIKSQGGMAAIPGSGLRSNPILAHSNSKGEKSS